MNAVEFAYMLPKRIMEQMGSNTPSMSLSNDRQLASFITLLKTNVMCIYVSLTANKGRHDHETMKPSQESMKPSQETMKPSLDTMKPSQLRKSETIKSGDIFSGKKELIMKLHKLSVIERFDFIIKKSWNLLFYAKCYVPGCSWKILASTMSISSQEFLIRKYNDLHTCSGAVRYARHRQANAKCIGKMYVEGFSGGSDRKGIRPKYIMDCIRAVYQIEIGYTKAHNALAYARKMVRGTHAGGYQDLPTYLFRIEKANPGFPFMRRVIVIDGANLSDGEDAAAWEWFFTQLRRVVGDGRNLAFISDRCPAIVTALTNVFPEADRGICLYHLGQNMISGRKKTQMVALAKKAVEKVAFKRFAERREKAVSLKTNFTGAVELALHMRYANMGTLAVQHIDANRSDVTGTQLKCMVDLEKRTCTCKQFDLDKILCEHAIKVAQSRKIDEATLVDPPLHKRATWLQHTQNLLTLQMKIFSHQPMYLVKCACHPKLANNMVDLR
ncbi:hypothetical protein Bca101_010297 [Brassica carinata]